MRLGLFDVGRDQSGTGLVEFTLVLPVLLFLVLGVAQFGLIFYNYISVANAAAYGARIFAISRSTTGGSSPTPYTSTVAAVQSASSSTAGNLTITLSVNGTACTSDTSCETDLVNAHTANVANTTLATPLQGASVTVSYPCTANLIPTYLINLAGICPLTSTMQQVVE